MIHLQKHFKPMDVIASGSLLPMSLTAALDGLRKRGYQFKLRRDANCLYCIDLGIWFLPDEFTVDEYYHFEDSTNAYGDKMLYAVSSAGGLKGFIVDTYYAYADSDSEYELAEEY